MEKTEINEIEWLDFISIIFIIIIFVYKSSNVILTCAFINFIWVPNHFIGIFIPDTLWILFWKSIIFCKKLVVLHETIFSLIRLEKSYIDYRNYQLTIQHLLFSCMDRCTWPLFHLLGFSEANQYQSLKTALADY